MAVFPSVHVCQRANPTDRIADPGEGWSGSASNLQEKNLNRIWPPIKRMWVKIFNIYYHFTIFKLHYSQQLVFLTNCLDLYPPCNEMNTCWYAIRCPFIWCLIKLYIIMVLISNGNAEIGAQVRSDLYYLIWLRHLITVTYRQSLKIDIRWVKCRENSNNIKGQPNSAPVDKYYSTWAVRGFRCYPKFHL